MDAAGSLRHRAYVNSYNASGSRDPAFGDDGAASVKLSGDLDVDLVNGVQFTELQNGEVAMILQDNRHVAPEAIGTAVLIGPTGIDAQASVPRGAVVDHAGRVIYFADGLLHRSNWDGSVDPSFSADGAAPLPGGGSSSALAVGNDDAVYSLDAEAGSIAKFTPAGEPDLTFGSGGVVTPSADSRPVLDFVLSVFGFTVDVEGRVYVAYELNGPVIFGPLGPDLLRLTPDGMLDSSFAGGGAIASISPSGIEIGAMDQIGQVSPTASQESMSGRFLTLDGLEDQGFANDGFVEVHCGLMRADANALAFEPDGDVLLAGYAFRRSFLDRHFAIARLTAASGPDDLDADGVLDAADRCATVGSTRAGGCPLAARRLTLRRSSSRTLKGVLSAPIRGCLRRGARVHLIKLGQPGFNRRVHLDRDQLRAKFVVAGLRSGRYRAVTPAISASGLADCEAANSVVRRLP